MSEVTPRDREEKLLAAIAEGATGKLPTPRNRKEKLLKEIYDNGSTGGGGAGGVTPEQVKAILLANTDNALNGASSNPIANKALVDALANYVKSTDLSIPTKVSELTNDKKYQTDSDLVTALTPYAKSDDVTTEIIAEIAKVVADAPEDFNTLKEMSDWISNHENDASAMNSAISDNKTAITALQTGKADKSEIPTTVSELTDSDDYAKKTDLHSHENKTVLDGITEEKVTAWDNKSDFSGSYNDLNDKPTIDAELSNTSENAIQNKVVAKEINKLYSDISFNDFDTATSGASFTDAENGNMLVTDWTKNLLNPTLETCEVNGVTCTRNVDANGKPDGTYTLNGTATGENAVFRVNISCCIEYGKTYRLVGCPQSGGSGKYGLEATDQTIYGVNDYGDGAIFNPYETGYEYKILIVVYINHTVNNLVFKPMLTTDLEATYDDFVPYSGYDIKTCGKNLLNLTKITTNNTGATASLSNGIITLDRTVDTSGGWQDIYFNTPEQYVSLKRGVKYTISTKDKVQKVFILLRKATGLEILYTHDCYTNGTTFVASEDMVCQVTITFKESSTFNNTQIAPQIEVGEKATEYEPYNDGGTVHIDSSTKFPLLGLKTFNGITNIISPANVKCVYPTNESGKGVLDSLYNKDKMLTEQNESLSVIGKCKNLLKPTLQTTTQNGVTCTNNGDGTYTVDGTATSDVYFNIANFTLTGTYKILGAPKSEAVSKFYVGGFGIYYAPYSGTINKYDNTSIQYAIAIASGVTVNKELFKPMITTDLNATYDDFVPYTGDGETLASDVAEIKNDLGGLTFSASGTTLTITDGTNTWTLGANS